MRNILRVDDHLPEIAAGELNDLFPLDALGGESLKQLV